MINREEASMAATQTQSERVTYLTNPEQKAALEAFAKERGESVGSVLREAAARYMAEPAPTPEEEEALKLLLAELNEAVPRMNAQLQSSIDRLRETRAYVDRTLREAGLRP
jgi:hypothetical protein